MHRMRTLAAPLATLASVAALAAPAAAQDLRSPDAIDAARGHRTPDLRSPDAIDDAAGRTPADVTTPPTAPPLVELTPSQGFDWGDAAIGAGGATGLLAISLAGAMTLRRRRPSSQATRS